MTTRSLGSIFGLVRQPEANPEDLQAQADREAIEALRRMKEVPEQAQAAIIELDAARATLHAARTATEEHHRG